MREDVATCGKTNGKDFSVERLAIPFENVGHNFESVCVVDSVIDFWGEEACISKSSEVDDYRFISLESCLVYHILGYSCLSSCTQPR